MLHRREAEDQAARNRARDEAITHTRQREAAAKRSPALTGAVVISLFRLGWPLQVFFNYQTLSVIPGKNARGPDVISAGIRVPAKFW